MKKRCLVLVTVDCLRADHVGFLGYRRPVTPTLDSLAAQSVVFEDAIVAGAPTYFSFPGIMASRHPLSLGRTVLGIAPQESTLATALHDSGYRTGAFVAGNPYLTARFGYDQGFDEFRDFMTAAAATELMPGAHVPLSKLNRWIDEVSHRNRVAGASYDELYFWYCQWRSSRQRVSLDGLRRYPAADVLVDHATDWMRGLGEEDFFLWIHLMDPHHPYYPPTDAMMAVGAPAVTAQRARFLNSFWNRGDIGPTRWQKYRDEILSLYDAGIYWVDKQIGRLIKILQSLGRWDETVFAVTADHGEEFLEHGVRYHSPVHLPEELIRVPLLIRAPGLGAAKIESVFSHIHLAPTLLDSVGAVVPPTFVGRSRWGEISAGQLSPETVVVECLDGCNNPFQVKDRIRPRLLAVRDREHMLTIRFGENRETFSSVKEGRENEASASAKKKYAQFVRRAGEHVKLATRNRRSQTAMRARIRELRYEGGSGIEMEIGPKTGG